MKSVFKLTSLQMGLLLILMPILCLIMQQGIALISIFTGATLVFPLFYISLFIVFNIYFAWIWFLGVTLNKKVFGINNKLFKIAFVFHFIYRVLEFINNLDLEILEMGIYLEKSTLLVIELIAFVFGLTVLISYFYIAYFIGKIVKLIPSKSSGAFRERFPKYFFLIGFPIGIPLLQTQIRSFLKENELFGFKYSTSSRAKQLQQKQKSLNKSDSLPKKEIDKEDHKRFMPK